MKRSIKLILIGAMVLSVLAVASACSKGSSQSQSEKSEAAKEEVSASKLNFDMANLIGDDYDGIVAEFGEPQSDTGEGAANRTLTYADKTVELITVANDDDYYTSCISIATNFGELFEQSASKLSKDDFINSLDAEIETTTEGDVLSFELEGYKIDITMDSDGNITKDSKAVINLIEDDNE